MRKGSRLRKAMLWYVVASMVVGQILTLEELVLGLDLPPWTVFLTSLVLVPLPAAYVGWLRGHEYDDGEGVSDFRVVAWTVGGFLVWTLMYFTTGWLSRGAHMHSMHTVLDEMVPYVPETIFVYLTVYHAFAIPFLAQDDPGVVRWLMKVVMTILVVDMGIMLLYPVAMVRPEPMGPPLTAWFLELVHGADPSHNCFPSSHCSVAFFAVLALWVTGRRKLAAYMALSALAISISTMTTRQHYGVDVIAGWGTVLAIWGMFGYNGAPIGGQE